jgi:hypothetical protein
MHPLKDKKFTSKTLTFPNVGTITNLPIQNIFSNVNTPITNPGEISTNILHVKKNIISPTASIAHMNFYYDPATDTGCLCNTSKNFIIKINDNPQSITLLQNGDVVVGSNLNVVENITTTDGNFTGDIMANNANLLGDIVSTNSYITNNFTVDGITTTKNVNMHGDLNINGFLSYVQGIKTDNLVVNKSFKTGSIETTSVGSPTDLNIVAGTNQSVNIPNIRHNVALTNTNVITPIAIKSTKIFIVSQNIILEADETCNGIEIIIYNNNVSGNIIVRDLLSIIARVPNKCSVKMVYIFLINQWIKI